MWGVRRFYSALFDFAETEGELEEPRAGRGGLMASIGAVTAVYERWNSALERKNKNCDRAQPMLAGHGHSLLSALNH